METSEIRRKFLEFFAARGHVVVPSSSLLPDDPSVLFTTAGMQQFKPYYTDPRAAKKRFGGVNVASAQKCFRTSDIDEVGDERHLTFFEMLGNFSFGGYFKEEAIGYAHKFITEMMNLPISYVTVFRGEPGIAVSRDDESAKIWRDLGVKDVKEEGMEDVFWGPTGGEGPCGPTTEVYCTNALGEAIEVWNIVFNEYFCGGSREELAAGKAKLTPLKTKGIDTGLGLERLAVVREKKRNVFETDIFVPLIARIGNVGREGRIIADHVRAAGHLIEDGVRPSNVGRGYILRRLIRRAARYGRVIGVEVTPLVSEAARPVVAEEEQKFLQTLEKGMKEFERGMDPFTLFTTYGFPIEMTEELARERGTAIDRAAFEKKLREHQDVSRRGAGMFKGGLAGTGEIETKYHTATHLLHQALRDVLGGHVEQRGSNITAERLRFDFSHHAPMTVEEIARVERIVNEKIAADLPVTKETMTPEKAKACGAIGLFGDMYGETVTVYSIGAYSKEICGGPHVERTGEIGPIKIVKEESSAAGVRRLRAVLA